MSSTPTSEIILLLQSKLELFKQYEACCAEMMHRASEDSIQDLSDQLVAISEQIDELDARAADLIEGQNDAERITSAIKTACDRSALSGQLAEMYDLGSEIRAIISRVMERNSELLARFRREQDQIREKIAQTNRTPAAQISKYYTPQRDTPDANLIGEKFRKG